MRRLNETFGSKALSEITTQDVERFKGHLAQIVAPATVNRHLALLSGVFNKTVAWAITYVRAFVDFGVVFQIELAHICEQHILSVA